MFIDHGSGLVIERQPLWEKGGHAFYHGETLGGTGKDTGKRHPTVRRGGLAHAQVIGPPEIGEKSQGRSRCS